MTRGNPLLDADPGAATWLSIDGSILFLRNRDTQPESAEVGTLGGWIA